MPTVIANIITSTIAHNSSSDYYTDHFERFKSRQEKKKIKFSSDNLKSYNLPFTMAQLMTQLLDQTVYIIKCSKTCQKYFWLHYYETSMICGVTINFLSSWSKATIIPIPK